MEMRETLRELWTADLITVDTQRLVARRGNRVLITTTGERLLREWAMADESQAAA
jgi:hypothetical protein